MPRGPLDPKELGFSFELSQVGMEMVVPIVGGRSKSEHILGMTQELAKNKVQVDILINSASLFYKTPLENVAEDPRPDI